MEDLNKYLFVIKLRKFKLNYFFYSYNNFLLHHHEIVMIDHDLFYACDHD